MNKLFTIFTNLDNSNLHLAVFRMCAGISLLAFLALFCALIFYHTLALSKRARFDKTFFLEMIWFVIPLFLFVLMAMPATYNLVSKQPLAAKTVNPSCQGRMRQ